MIPSINSRFARRVFVVAGALILSSAPAIAQETGSASVPEVETVGTGERRVAPDRATLHLQIMSKARTASLAASNNAKSQQRVRDTLKLLGLESAVTTASYNVSPNWEHPEPRVRGEPVRDGYVAHTVLRVQLSKLNEAGSVIDAALAAGATGVDGIMFESSMFIEARRGALADAAAAARADAEALAKAMGGTLGPLISTSTAASNDPRRGNLMMRMGGAGGMAMASPTQITPNEIVVTAGVAARWRFIPGR